MISALSSFEVAFSRLVNNDLALLVLSVGLLLIVLPILNSDSERARCFVFVVYAAAALRYVYWRVLRGHSPFELDGRYVFSTYYFIFELWVMWRSVMGFRTLTKRRSRLAEADRNEGWYAKPGAAPPLVDLFIPTYNESPEILEKAVFSALRQDYERVRVWVLDDGRRGWLRDFTERRGAGYLTRHDNAGFKAGNLNNALKHVMSLEEKPDFILVLDCDFVAKPSLVRRALTLMKDETTAVVQTPQVYYNPDPLQYALSAERHLPDWMRTAFDAWLPAMDVFDGVRCIGTCFLIRRTAVEAIDGFPTQSVSEDALTSMKLNPLGLRTVYLNEQLSYGLVAEGLRELLTQCGRWCLGGVQIIHLPWGPLRRKGAWLSRYYELEGFLAWGITSGTQLLFMFSSLLFWYTGFTLLPVGGLFGDEYMAYFVPYFVVQLAANFWMTKGAEPPLITDARSLLCAPVVVVATLRGLVNSKNARFNVTDKGAIRSGIVVHWRLLRWVLLFALLSIGGMIYTALDPTAPCNRMGYRNVAYFWGYYQLLVMAIAATICVELPKRRTEERFATGETVRLTSARVASTVQLADISMTGVRICTGLELELGSTVRCELTGVGVLAATVVRKTEDGFGLQLGTTEDERELLVAKLFTDRYIKTVRRGRAISMYRAALKRAFS